MKNQSIGFTDRSAETTAAASRLGVHARLLALSRIAAAVCGVMLLLGPGRSTASETPPHPNILWLVAEDSNVGWFGCYGNPEANTPNIDRLAAEGFRYTNVFASAPVCTAQRSAWITGMESLSTGTHPMRSRNPIPHDLIRYYPDYLNEAGYFTANHTKTDYNIGGRPDTDCWDSDTARAWEKRKPGQPFFQVINFNQSHESRAQGDVTQTRHSPQDVTLRKYHPDEQGIRQNYAKYYDAVQRMDAEVGKALAALEDAGLAEDTIVVFCSDHGGVMPRSKRFLFDSGIHTPLIIRAPEKFKSLWPASKPGMTVDRLVGFIDFPKTWLSLAGAEVPPLMQGHVFLGEHAEPEPEYVFSYRGRMDERLDNQRSVRDKRFVYIKNYMPYVPWGQRLDYMWKLVATRTWEDAWVNHRTDQVTGRFFETKPVEELYDMQADPDNVVNLAEDPAHQARLQTMRSQLRQWQLAVHDTGLLPEAERVKRAANNKQTIYEMVRDPKLYDLPAYLDAADLALAGQATNRSRLLALLNDPDSCLRYWGAVGLMVLGPADKPTQAQLREALEDPCTEVAVMAAWTLHNSGDKASAQQALSKLLTRDSDSQVMVLNALDWMHADLTPYQKALGKISAGSKDKESYPRRMVGNLRATKRRE